MFRLFRFLDRNRPARKPRPKPPPKVRTFRPCLEELENRLVPAAATYTVNTLTDNNPNGGGNGDGLTGDFRYCLTQALANPGSTVEFQQGVNGIIDITQPLPAINNNVTIGGPGYSQVTVQRDPNAGQFRMFTVNPGVTAEIDGLTIQNGWIDGQGGGIFNQGNLTLADDKVSYNQAINPGGAAGLGGGIYNTFGANLTVNDSVISQNTASTGGGGIASWGTVLVEYNSTIWGNTATSGGAFFVGNGTTTVSDDTMVLYNTASKYGGGVYVFLGTFNMQGGGFGYNSAQTGGAVSNPGLGTVNLYDLGLGMNTAANGGALYSAGNTTLDNVTIQGNTATANGPGIYPRQTHFRELANQGVAPSSQCPNLPASA
jgi:hypothetical protein